jgi:two-component system, NarL family, response regulator NreC
MPHRILLADDHDGIRRRVRSALEDAGFDVCGEAANGQEAVRQTKELMPDLIVLNLSMPIMNGLEALPQIAKLVPSAKVLIFTMDDGDELRSEAFRRGAHGFLSKCSPLSELVEGIEKLLK